MKRLIENYQKTLQEYRDMESEREKAKSRISSTQHKLNKLRSEGIDNGNEEQCLIDELKRANNECLFYKKAMRQSKAMKSIIEEDLLNRLQKHQLPDVDISSTLSELIAELNDLRMKYQDFSSDLTRIASMRAIASGFVSELDLILQKALKQG